MVVESWLANVFAGVAIVFVIACALVLWLDRRYKLFKDSTPDMDPLRAASMASAFGSKQDAIEILEEAIKVQPARRKEFESKIAQLKQPPGQGNPVQKL